MCVLNAISWEAYFGGDGNVGSLFECVLGVSLMKGGYWVFDTGNREASVAFASSSNSDSDAGRGSVVGVPSGGVRMLKL